MKNNTSKTIISGLFCLLWMAWTIYSAWMTGPVISDSWQSVGAAVRSKHPFDLSGLYLSNFDGYSITWGHHWPGWPMLLSLLFFWIPFHSLIVFFIESVILLTIAIIAYQQGRRETPWYVASLIFFLVLIDPAQHVGLSMMRPENLVALLFLLLCQKFLSKDSQNHRIFFIFLIAATLPFIHIMGCIGAPALVIARWASLRFSVRDLWNDSARPSLLFLLAGWGAGCFGLLVWFTANQYRWNHFSQNLEAQRLSLHGLWNCFDACYLDDISGLMTLLLWLIVAFCCIVQLWRKKPCLDILSYGMIALVCVAFSFVVKNPNRLHLVTVYPCAVVAVVLSLSGYFKESKRQFYITAFLFSLVVLFAIAFHGKRVYSFALNSMRDQRIASEEFISKYRNNGNVFLPSSLWEAAAHLKFQRCYFYTFPNVATPSYRHECEKHLWSHAELGDTMILDYTQQSKGNPFFHEQALDRISLFNPYDLGPVIETVTIDGMQGKRIYQVIRVSALPKS